MNRSRTVRVAALLAAGVAPALVHSTAGATTVPEAELNAWAIDYTGGPGGEATGDPIRIGYASSTELVPETTMGAMAAAEYVNAELGGVGGRPIELVECTVSVAEDGASCGAEFANDDSIDLVITGAIVFGGGDFYAALNGNTAVIIGNGGTVDDFVTPAGQSYVAGAAGVVSGMAEFTIDEFAPESVAVLAADNPAGHAGVDVLLKPIIEEAGVEAKVVYVADTATAPDIASAMQAAGADTADVVAAGIPIQNCINMYDAIQSLGIDPIVVTTGLCYDTPMMTHMHDLGEEGDFPNGWYFGGYGYSYFRPDLASGTLTYVTKIQEYGEALPGIDAIQYTGLAGPTFAAILTGVKFMNAIGADNLSYETLDEQVRTFTGPMMLQVGPIECGIPPFVTTCAHQMGIQQYLDGEWVSIRDGVNDNPVDMTPDG